MDPINYSVDVQTPFQAALQGYQAGAAIRNDQFQQQQQQQALALQKQMQLDVAAVANNPNAGARDYAALTLKYPALKDQFKQSWDMVGKDQQGAKLDLMTRAYSALSTGRPDVAEQLMRDRAAAMRNSGAPEHDVKAQEMWADMIKASPDQARHIGGLMLSSVMDPDKFSTTFGQLGSEGRAADKAPAEQRTAEAEATIKEAAAAVAPQSEAQKLQTGVWNNANTRSQIEERAGRLALDKDKLRSDVELELYKLKQKAGELDDGAKKLINDSTIAAVSADQSASQMLDLAGRLEASGASSGASAKGAELYKSITGNQDAITQLRQEYTRLRSTQVSKMLPPGPASDKDIQLALSGFPSETADPATMAGFIRGMAKLQQADAAVSSAKAEWVNSVGHLGKPKTDIEIDGIKVPAGSTFVDFSRQFMQRRVDERAAQQATQQVQGRSYMRFAQPAAAAPAASAPAPGQLGSGTFGIQ